MGIPKRFAVISDIHLRAGKYGDSHEKFLKAMRWCGKEDLVLYYAGDIIEGYDRNNDLEELDDRVRYVIMNAIMDGVLVSGNHDNDLLGDGSRMPVIHDRRRKIAICHGQRFDLNYKDEEQEMGNDFWSKLAHRFDIFGVPTLGTAARSVRNIGFQDRALEYMGKNSLRLMVCGHTHDPEIVVSNDMTLAIGGSWKESATDKQRRIVLVENYTAQLVGLEDMA